MRKRFRTTLIGDETGKMETAAINLPFDAREVWGKARVPVKVTIKKEYVQWFTEAKKEETRTRRVEKTKKLLSR